MGQDVFFVGFPFGMSSEGKASFQIIYPFAFVKRATVSAVRSETVSEKIQTQYVLDGLNIGGFSGSPIIYRPGTGDQRVMAVISGFQPDYGPVLTPKEIRPEQVMPEDYGKGRIVEKNGHTYRLEEAKEMKDAQYVVLNTGIVRAWDIQLAVELVRLHPDGPKVTADFKPSLAP